jgi:tetraacyldisaccharide 4'-kinase
MSILDYLNPYAYIMRARRMMYERGILKSFHPGISVISIGNLSLGGTGKSPMIIKIVNYLHANGKRVAVVSRGYRRKSKGFVLVRDGDEILVDVEQSGDEAQMLAEALPYAIIIVDEDRVHGARQAKNLGADVVLLDDGYQHLRIQRDLNILLVDASLRKGKVIPFGRLREPMNAARAANIILMVEESDDKIWRDLDRFFRPNTLKAKVRASPIALEAIGNAPPFELNNLVGKHILAVSSIANSHRFYDMLRTLGCIVIELDLGDHAEYTTAVATKILRDSKALNVDFIVTTTKDGVKSRRYFEHTDEKVYILKHDLEFLSGERSFYETIDRTL